MDKITLSKKRTGIKSTSIIIALIFFIQLNLHAQEYAWVKHYESVTGMTGELVAAGASGSNYGIASFGGTVAIDGEIFAAEDNNRLLIRHNGAGELSWVRPLRGLDVTALRTTGDFVYVAGSYSSDSAAVAGQLLGASAGSEDGFIVRLTKEGVVDLIISIRGTEGDKVDDMDVDAAGNMVVTGACSEITMFGDSAVTADGLHMFVARFNNDGSTAWVRNNSGMSSLKISTDWQSTQIYVAAYAGAENVVTFSHDSYTYTVPDNEYGDYMLLTFDDQGNFLKLKTLIASFRRTVAAIDATETNELYVLWTHMYTDGRILKFDNQLNELWALEIPDNGNIIVGYLATDLLGNVFVTGNVMSSRSISGTTFGSPGIGSHSGFVAKYSTEGELLWLTGVKTLTDGDKGAIIRCVDTDNLNDVYIIGDISGKAEFVGYGTYEATAGTRDLYVARIEGHSDYTSLPEEQAGTLKVYPAVNDGHFTVALNENSGGTLYITDISGRCVYSGELAKGEGLTRVACNLKNGVYIVNYRESGQSVARSKIIVMQ